jgi:hypothetical protein
MRLTLSGGLAMLGLAALVLTDCAATPAPPRLGLKLTPAAFQGAVSLQQRLVLERDGRIDAIDAALEVDAERVDLVGFTVGQRIFSLHYDGKELQSWRHPAVPLELRGEEVLEDLQLTLWPSEAIAQALPVGWGIEEAGRRRTLSFNEVPVMMIDYSGEPRWLGQIAVNNLRYHYRLTILSVPAG